MAKQTQREKNLQAWEKIRRVAKRGDGLCVIAHDLLENDKIAFSSYLHVCKAIENERKLTQNYSCYLWKFDSVGTKQRLEFCSRQIRKLSKKVKK